MADWPFTILIWCLGLNAELAKEKLKPGFEARSQIEAFGLFQLQLFSCHKGLFLNWSKKLFFLVVYAVMKLPDSDWISFPKAKFSMIK